jgi:ABC-type nitrate/sulfonate/bicarbonate transport system permease component
VPAAFLGAVLGEFFGKIESGVGIAMILAQQNSNAPLVWALALASGAVALLGFNAAGARRPRDRTLVEGKVMATLPLPHKGRHEHQAHRTARRRPQSRCAPRGGPGRSARPRLEPSHLRLTLLAALAIWVGVLWVFQISPLIAKGPVDVWNYFFTVPAAAANRELIMGNLMVTLGSRVIGFIAGLVAAILAAALFQLSKGAEHALMPIAMLLRSGAR